jgi:hypothetical protein
MYLGWGVGWGGRYGQIGQTMEGNLEEVLYGVLRVLRFRGTVGTKGQGYCGFYAVRCVCTSTTRLGRSGFCTSSCAACDHVVHATYNMRKH